jgi:hypothetical protein
MFYTIASKIPYISNVKPNNKFLTIFILGSLLYIFLHYYLYSKSRGQFPDKIKGYLYYIMGIDLIIAYVISKYFSNSTDLESDQTDTNNSDNNIVTHKKGNMNYTGSEREQINRNINNINDINDYKKSRMIQNQRMHNDQEQYYTRQHHQYRNYNNYNDREREREREKEREREREKETNNNYNNKNQINQNDEEKSNQSPFMNQDDIRKEEEEKEKERKKQKLSKSKSEEESEKQESSQKQESQINNQNQSKKIKKSKPVIEDTDADIPIYKKTESDEE